MTRRRYDKVAPALSPDGRLLAYGSNESGRYEIHVRTSPGGEREEGTQ